MRIIKPIAISFILILIVFFSYYAFTFEFPKLFTFNKENSLHGWKEKVFKDKVLYIVEPKQEGGYLQAESIAACSGLFYKMRFDPKDYPMISWKWKVLNFPDKSKIHTEDDGWVEKDDYPARVYVIFPSFIFSNTKSIEYVWDETMLEGTTMTSPYLKNIKIIVVESGKENINQWVQEERNIYQDYIMFFGKEPRDVGAIAILTDADNTLSTAEALYKDIKVGYKNE